MSYSSTNLLPKIYTGSAISTEGINFIEIDYTVMNFINVPNITVTSISDNFGVNDTANINIFITELTKRKAKINFPTDFIGTVNYIVVGFI